MTPVLASPTSAARSRPGSRRLQALQRKTARSLYEQLADRFREHIVSACEPGGSFPTEEALMRTYGVSRSTVRKALQRLVDEGALVRRQGKGTFVSQPTPTIVHAIDRLAPFMETFRRVGEDIHMEVMDFSWIDRPDLPDELDAWERPVLRFQRRYVSRGVPHAITSIVVPHAIGRRITRADVDSRPIYDILQKKLRLRLTTADFLVSGRQPSPAVSDALEISQSSFLLVLDRVTHDELGKPVEMTTHFLRPDVYRLSVSLTDLAAAR